MAPSFISRHEASGKATWSTTERAIREIVAARMTASQVGEPPKRSGYTLTILGEWPRPAE